MHTETLADKLPVQQQCSPGALLRGWLALSVQSFGGGVATLALIRQTAVERYQWLSEEEFTRDWALVQIVPGINLLALTILIGKRVAGWRGVAACLLGLLLPSVMITILLTASYAQIQRQPLMQAALRGIVPATVGLGLVTAVQMARPILAASRKTGAFSLLVALFTLVASGIVILYRSSAVVPILCLAGLLGALTHWHQERRRTAAKQNALRQSQQAQQAQNEQEESA